MRTLALLLTLAIPSSATVKNPDTFTYLSIGDIDSMDPAWSYDTASHLLIANIYEPLLVYKGSGMTPKDLIPHLAERVPTVENGLISKDGLTYTFPIRQGVKFQDGSPLTAEDVRYSLTRFMLMDRDAGPSSLLLEPVLGISSTRQDGKLIPGIYERLTKAVTVKDRSVVIKLNKPFAPFLTILVSYGSIVSKSWCAANGQWNGEAGTWQEFNNPKRESSALMEKANGTGPFVLARIDKKTSEMVLERNDNYWRKPASLKRVIIKKVDEFATRKLMLQAGDADSIYGPQMYFPQLQNLDGVELIDGLQNLERSPMVFFSMKMNPVANPNIGSGKLDGHGIPPDFFSDKDARKAVAYSIDYDAYIRDIVRGKGRQGSSFIPPGLIGYREGAKYSLDLAKATEHFKKAWGGQAWEKGIKFTLLHNTGSAPAQTICQMLKKNLESLNPKFKIDVRGLQWSTFLEMNKAHKLPLHTGAWLADFPDAHNFAFPLLHSNGYFPSQNGYKNPAVDALVDEAVTTLDVKKREKLYHKLQDIFYEDLPFIFIAEGYRYRTHRKWVKGFVFNPIFPDSPYGDYYYNISKSE